MGDQEMNTSKMEDKQEEILKPIFRDIRRYPCQFCGITRSKKSLLNSHMLTHHKEEVEKQRVDEENITKEEKTNTCGECGATFRKPAHLTQHMQSHSLERPFRCLVDDCHASYRRKDHLNRHLLQHEGKLFECPNVNCRRKFAFQTNMKRHFKEFHDEDANSSNIQAQKQYVCQEAGCGKVFKFASKLRKHEDSHVELQCVEAFCAERGCMKPFTNKECLKAHIQSCHQYIACEICGKKQLRKNIKRHLRSHESKDPSEKIKCHFEGCLQTFSSKSNLQQHVKAVHHGLKPFVCCFPGCGMRFSYKHVRDNHERSGIHMYTPGDFEESDEQFRSRPRGGRKRKLPTVEMLVRKRITTPGKLDSHPSQGSEPCNRSCIPETNGDE